MGREETRESWPGSCFRFGVRAMPYGIVPPARSCAHVRPAPPSPGRRRRRPRSHGVKRVPDRGIPADVQRFIADHIDAAEQLDVLLLLHRQPEKAFDCEAVAAAVYTVAPAAEKRLEALEAHGLLAADRSGPRPTWRYQPRDAALARTVDAVAEAYRRSRVDVINLVYSRPADPLRSFADAFKLRKDT